MLILGIDPGKDGAVVYTETFENIPGRVACGGFRIKPLLADGKYSERAMIELLSPDKQDISLVVIERQHAMPKQGSTSAYSIGLGEGLWRGVFAALRVPVELVRAVDWQKAVARGDGVDPKAKGILACQRLLPGLDLLDGGRLRKPHTGLADAGCMAVYGWRLLAGKEG